MQSQQHKQAKHPLTKTKKLIFPIPSQEQQPGIEIRLQFSYVKKQKNNGDNNAKTQWLEQDKTLFLSHERSLKRNHLGQVVASVIKNPATYIATPPFLASCLSLQDGCWSSSHYALVPAIRKEDRDQKGRLVPFKDTFLKFYIHFHLQIIGQNSHIATLGCQIVWEMQFWLYVCVPDTCQVLITKRKRGQIVGQTHCL